MMPSNGSKNLNLHRFLWENCFHPLALGSLLGLAFLWFRTLQTHNTIYGFLTWNLFLAWMPYACSLALLWLHRKGRASRILAIPLSAGWLLFLPNAPYILTDFVHFHRLTPYVWWYDLGLIATFAWTGCFLGVASLSIMHSLVRERWGNPISWGFVGLSAALSGYGVYLGRFLRWNSWDMVTHPQQLLVDVLSPIFNPASHPRAVGFTLMFGAMVFLCYLTFLGLRASSNASSARS